MPQSITIAAFVFGAVLLLISIVGGNFKIFAAEVSGTTGRFGRLFSGATGIILIIVGLVGSNARVGGGDKPPLQATTTVSPASSPSAQSPKDVAKPAAAAEPPADAREKEPRAEPVIDIDGSWHDATGATYRVSQRQNSFTFIGSGPNVTTEGHGIIHGPGVESNYVNTYANGMRSTGHCAGTLSANGSMITGTCFDSMFGQGPSILSR